MVLHFGHESFIKSIITSLSDLIYAYFSKVKSEKCIGKIIRSYPSPFLVSSPVAFKVLNVLILNIAEKMLAGR